MSTQKLLHFGFGFLKLKMAFLFFLLFHPGSEDFDQILDDVFLVFSLNQAVSFKLGNLILAENANFFVFLGGTFIFRLIMVIMTINPIDVKLVFDPQHLI